MNPWRRLATVILVATAVWALFSWPLPRHFTSAVPYSARQTGRTFETYTLPGDPVQFLYYLWLAGDMIKGQTPLFYNLYEFNTGDDQATYQPGPYYAPFTLMYLAFSEIGGRVIGWNLTGLATLWITYWLTWLLTRRYSRDETIAALAALLSILLPFRWHNLMGGSPMGFAMIWPPLLFLGIDKAVRDSRWTGGLLAGLALLMAKVTESHVFFFGTLATPVWGLIALVNRPEFRWSRGRDYGAILLAMLPAVPLLAAALGLTHLMNRELAASAVEGGRTIGEVALFSPEWSGLFSWADHNLGNHIYVGSVLAALCAAGLALLAANCRKRPGRPAGRALLTGLLLAGMATGIVFLALGVHGPFEGRCLLAARKLVPPYAMIRQVFKIYCLMPSVLAVLLALSLGCLIPAGGSRRRQQWILALLSLILIADYRLQVRTVVCTLEMEQAAYRTVADDAHARGRDPRVLVLPLWPGDTHFTSLYQHYVSLYRIRMANGYSPVVSRNYTEQFFRPFESANQGYLTPDQVDALLARGLDYLLLHEDLFPEKVSPFPVSQTLKSLLNHPRMKLLAHADSVWAFRILPTSEPRAPMGETWRTGFPARWWTAAQCRREPPPDTSVPPPAIIRTVNLPIQAGALASPTVYLAPVPSPAFMVRLRGHATLSADILAATHPVQGSTRDVRSATWTWVRIPLPAFDTVTNVSLRLTAVSGQVEVDSLFLTGEPDLGLSEPGSSVRLPAPGFFHAGSVSLERNSVFLPAGKRDGALFYGPKLPLEPGRYAVTLDFDAPGAPGIPAGTLTVEAEDRMTQGETAIVVGQPARLEWTHAENYPANIIVSTLGTVPLDLKEVTLSRIR